MTTLFNQTKNMKLSSNLKTASNLWSRTKGLLGKKNLIEDEMLWIHRCNSIHTFGMKFAIDCVFLDKNLVVCATKTEVKPYRMVLPIFRAQSVIEMNSGKIKELTIQIGDQLHVGN